MNNDDSRRNALERRLASIPRVDLPADMRAGVLANACPTGRGEAKSKFWKQSPRPLAAAIAAAWVVILGLQLTMPSSPESQLRGTHARLAADTDGDRGESLLVAWAERQRLIEQSL